MVSHPSLTARPCLDFLSGPFRNTRPLGNFPSDPFLKARMPLENCPAISAPRGHAWKICSALLQRPQMCARSPVLPFPRRACRSAFPVLPFPRGALMPGRAILSFPQRVEAFGKMSCPSRSARIPSENSSGFFWGAECPAFFSILPFARSADALGKLGPPFPRDLSVFFLQNPPHPPGR